jgi:hypothetical protein
MKPYGEPQNELDKYVDSLQEMSNLSTEKYFFVIYPHFGDTENKTMNMDIHALSH